MISGDLRSWNSNAFFPGCHLGPTKFEPDVKNLPRSTYFWHEVKRRIDITPSLFLIVSGARAAWVTVSTVCWSRCVSALADLCRLKSLHSHYNTYLLLPFATAVCEIASHCFNVRHSVWSLKRSLKGPIKSQMPFLHCYLLFLSPWCVGENIFLCFYILMLPFPWNDHFQRVEWLGCKAEAVLYFHIVDNGDIYFCLLLPCKHLGTIAGNA